MATSSRLNVSEGVVVLFAALVMTSSLCSLMVWHAVRGEADPAPPGAGADANAGLATVVASLEADRADLQSRLGTVEAGQGRLREERDTLESRLSESETRRLETKARAELDLDAAQSAQQRLVEKGSELEKRIRSLLDRNAELEMEVHMAATETADAGSDVAVVMPGMVSRDGPEPATTQDVSGRLIGGGARVVDANEGLAYVVFDAGSDEGVRPGMRFHVLVEDRVVARVRAVDVRTDLTGASVDGPVSGAFPKSDDRVVLMMNAEN